MFWKKRKRLSALSSMAGISKDQFWFGHNTNCKTGLEVQGFRPSLVLGFAFFFLPSCPANPKGFLGFHWKGSMQ